MFSSTAQNCYTGTPSGGRLIRQHIACQDLIKLHCLPAQAEQQCNAKSVSLHLSGLGQAADVVCQHWSEGMSFPSRSAYSGNIFTYQDWSSCIVCQHSLNSSVALVPVSTQTKQRSQSCFTCQDLVKLHWGIAGQLQAGGLPPQAQLGSGATAALPPQAGHERALTQRGPALPTRMGCPSAGLALPLTLPQLSAQLYHLQGDSRFKWCILRAV